MDTKNIIATLSQSLLDEVKKVMKKKGEKDESPAHEKSEKEDCSEALKGNQHKIDANKNGKVDAHDFKLLRKKKGVAETYADIQSGEEISEEDVEEAVKNPYAVGMAAAMKSTGDKPPLDKSTITKAHDIAKKIKEDTEEVSEESEQIDELSSDTLKSYRTKARAQGNKIVDKMKMGGGDWSKDQKDTQTLRKRSKGANMSGKQLVKRGESLKTEEAEQIDELSTNTVKSYKKAALASSPPESVFSDAKKYKQRTKGITMAQNRLNKEEVEEIDELSKSTLGSYIKKAATSAANKGMEHGTKKAERDEVDRMTNRHMSFGDKDKIHQTLKTTNRDVEAPREKAGKRIAGINMAVKKLTKEDAEIGLTQEEIDRIEATLADLEEGRGRPPKEGSDAWKKRQAAGAAEQDEPRQHPIQQLERIKRDMRGGADFKHKDGSAHHMTGGQAANLLSKYHGLKPAEKEVMQKEIHGSHAGLKKHL